MDILGKKKIIVGVTVLMVLAVTAVAVFRHCYLGPRTEPTEEGGYFYAVEISREQAEEEGYWVLTEPDEWVLKAILNPGVYVKIEGNETFFDQVLEHNHISNIQYFGRYYHVEIFGIDLKRPPYGLLRPVLVSHS